MVFFRRCVDLREQITEAQARRDAATEALRIAQNRYRNGYASYLDQLDAQRTSYTAEQTLVQLQAALLTAHVDLYRALGGGWQAGTTQRITDLLYAIPPSRGTQSRPD